MKTSVFVGVSLDGFLARTDGAFDFLGAGEKEEHGFDAFMASVDGLLIGRNTYDVVVPFPTWPYGTKPVFVLSHRELAAAPAGAVVERVEGAPAEVLGRLRARGLNHVYVDGGFTVQQFLRAGLIDRFVISRVPVLIGTGISLFGPIGRDIPLKHVATREYRSGMIQSEYEVVRDDG
jgi:dihydrofolate reductase